MARHQRVTKRAQLKDLQKSIQSAKTKSKFIFFYLFILFLLQLTNNLAQFGMLPRYFR